MTMFMTSKLGCKAILALLELVFMEVDTTRQPVTLAQTLSHLQETRGSTCSESTLPLRFILQLGRLEHFANRIAAMV